MTLLSRIAPALGLACLCLFMGVLQPAFATPSNLANVVQQSASNGVLAVGMTFVILTGGIDLSVGAILARCGVVLGSLLQAGVALPLAAGACLAIGVEQALRVIHGEKIPPEIATKVDVVTDGK